MAIENAVQLFGAVMPRLSDVLEDEMDRFVGPGDPDQARAAERRLGEVIVSHMGPRVFDPSEVSVVRTAPPLPLALSLWLWRCCVTPMGVVSAVGSRCRCPIPSPERPRGTT